MEYATTGNLHDYILEHKPHFFDQNVSPKRTPKGAKLEALAVLDCAGTVFPNFVWARSHPFQEHNPQGLEVREHLFDGEAKELRENWRFRGAKNFAWVPTSENYQLPHVNLLNVAGTRRHKL